MISSLARIPPGIRRPLLIAALLAAAGSALPGCWLLRRLGGPAEQEEGARVGAGSRTGDSPAGRMAPAGDRPESAYDTVEQFHLLARELEGFFEAAIPIRSGSIEVVPLVGWRQDCPWSEGCLTLEEAIEKGALGGEVSGNRVGFQTLTLENQGETPVYLIAGDVLAGDTLAATGLAWPGGKVLLHGVFLPPLCQQVEAFAADVQALELGRGGGGLLPGFPEASFRAGGVQAGEIHQRVEAAAGALLEQLLSSQGTCGFAVLSGGELRAVDLLHSGVLFRRLAPKLLRANLLELFAAEEAEPARARPERNGGAAEAPGNVSLTSLSDVTGRILDAPERARRVECFPAGIAFESPDCSGQVLFHPGGSVLHYRAFYR